MHTLPTLFAQIMASLQVAIGPFTLRNPRRAQVLSIAWYRIGRMVHRFRRLYDRWRAGTLPKPRKSRAGQAAKPRTRPRAYFPTIYGWLGQDVPPARSFGSQLDYLMRTPDFEEFLAAVPQARRMLRPLCHMLGPPAPRLPPPPRPTPPPIPASPAAATPRPVPPPARKFSAA